MTWFRRLRVYLHHCATATWTGLFRVLGHVRPTRRSWIPKGDQRVLIVAPHPDDEALGCGGVIAQHIACGDAVSVLIVTDGRLSRAGGLGPDEMARVRSVEAQRAADLLGVGELDRLSLPEGDWQHADLEARLGAAIRRTAPDIIYAPSWLDYHPEHIAVAACLARSVPDETTVRVYTLIVPLRHLANVHVDVSQQMPLLEQVFDAYETQRGSIVRGLRLRRYSGALTGCGKATEEFWELSGAAYRAAHRAGSSAPNVRAMRYWSFTDPLSYLLGERARRDIARRSKAV